MPPASRRTAVGHVARVAALGCAVPRLLVRLTFDDGLVLDVSHEPAFAPDCGPCRLREALTRPEPGRWLQHLVAAELCGPFVTVHDGAVVSWTEAGTECAALATDGDPADLVAWLRDAGPPDAIADAVEGNLLVNPDLGVHVVALQSTELAAAELADVARWIDANAPATMAPSPRR
jgi:hypothetical protein